MRSADADTRLQAYLDGELTPPEREAVEAALAASPELRERLERLRATNELARQSVAPEPPATLDDAIRARVEANRRSWRRLLPGTPRSYPLAWGFVTTVVLAALLLPFTNHQAVYQTFVPSAREKARRVSPGAARRIADAEAVEAMPSAAAPAVPGRASDAGPGGPGGPGAPGTPPAPAMPGPAMPVPGAAGAPGAPGEPVASDKSVGYAAAPGAPALAPAPGGRSAKVAAPPPTAEAASTVPTRGESYRPPRPVDDRFERAGEPLEAGEIDDNAAFGKYLSYLGQHTPSGLEAFRARERYVVQVVDPAGQGIPDCGLQLADAQGRPTGKIVARTDSSGQAALFAGLLPNGLPRGVQAMPVRGWYRPHPEATAGSPAQTVSRSPEGTTWRLVSQEPQATPSPIPLDVAFVVDTTGSMGEEIGQIRSGIDSVVARLNQLPQRTQQRLGMVTYRDHGDAYVTRAYPFVASVDAFRAQIAQVSADAGGDEPEDVQAALQVAIKQLQWSPPPALRLMFLIGDAPPHLDYQGEVPYRQSAREAAERGIKIEAVASSGMNDLGEYVWRQLAAVTRGRFVFITKGGAAGYTPHHVERQDYSVQRLPDLILNLIAREVAAWGRPPGEVPPVVIPPEPPTPPTPPAPPTPPPPPARDPLPLPAYLLILLSNLAGWLQAWWRSRRAW